MKTAIGLSTLIIGISGVIQVIVYIDNGAIQTRYLMHILIFLIVGGLIGSILNLSARLERFSQFIERKLNRGNQQFIQGFTSGTLIFCIGAMSLMGAINDGMLNNPTLLYSKSVLDGISSMILASTYGIGVLFTAIPVFIYQMSITILAHYFGNFIPLMTKDLMSAVGSILIVALSINILELKKIDVVNLLPAIFLPLIFLFIY